MKVKTYLYLILIFFILVAGFFIYKFNSFPKRQTVKIGQAKISVEIADSLDEKIKGLSGRKKFPENYGMLFVFEKPDYYSFWMKDMLIPLDFIWINNGQVVEITQNVKPEDYQPPKILVPQQKVEAVLEIKGGLAQKLNIKVGDKVVFE